MRWRSRSRARRTEARLRIRSPASSSSARVTVSLPVRRRCSSRRAGAAGRFSFGAAAGAQRAGRLFLLLGRHRHLAGGGERGNLGGGRLAGAFGDLAARFFLAAACLLVLGALLAPPRRCVCAPLPLRRACGPRSSARWRASCGGAFLFLAHADRPRPGRPGGATPRRPCGRPAGRAPGPPAPRRSARAARLPDGEPARPPAPARPAGRARRAAVAAGSARPGSGAAPGSNDPLLADLDRDGLRAAMRKALADLPGLDGAAQFEPGAAAAQGQRPLLLLLGGFLLVGFSHALRYRHPLVPAPPARNPSQGPPPRRREDRPAATDRATTGGTADRRATTACTIRSRPNAAPSSAAVSTLAAGRPRPTPASLRRPPSAPSSANSNSPALAPPHRLAHPVEPGDGEAGPAGETQRVAAPPRQQALDAVGKLRRHRNRPPRRPREHPLCHRPLHYIAARRQPQTPSGKPRLDIGHDRAVGTHDKAQQRAAVADLAGDDAAALGSGGGLRLPAPRQPLARGARR